MVYDNRKIILKKGMAGEKITKEF